MTAEDPATVLEQWIHDVANLPAEITHLYEEMEAKEDLIQEKRKTINNLDGSIQKFVKLHGSLVQNPKEEQWSKQVLDLYDQCKVLQAEKLGLAEKAVQLTDKHVKRFDHKVKDLQNEGAIALDPSVPSILRPESTGNLVPYSSSSNTGANTPLHPVSGNHGGGAPNLVSAAAIARLQNAVGANNRNLPSMQSMQAQAMMNRHNLTNAQSAIQAMTRQERDVSVGSDGKRRRPPGNLGTLPPPASGLARQPSVGAGTPKTGTPAGSRAGSVQPQRHALTVKRAKPHQPLRKTALTAKSGSNKSRRRKGGSRASPSTTADDDSVDGTGTEDEEMSGMGGGEEDESDDTKYCICQRVSFGDMVACDNDNCKYQWFHWPCVDIKEEPEGDWLCPECRKLPVNKIKKGR